MIMFSSQLASVAQTRLRPQRYGSANSLGYQDPTYDGLGSSYRRYNSAGLNRHCMDLDSYDMANRYPSKSFLPVWYLFICLVKLLIIAKLLTQWNLNVGSPTGMGKSEHAR